MNLTTFAHTNMKAMIQHLLFIILPACLSGFTELSAQTRHALFIGIGRYPAHSEWNTLHADNDLVILSRAFSVQGMKLHAIQNEHGTKANIVEALDRQSSLVHVGDTLLIHFSCHGQQMEDDNGDERDDLDEALIPYDAEMRYEKGSYEGENHLRDDELNRYLMAIRKKLGKHGLLIVSLDACHSTSGTRKDNEATVRGTDYIFSPSGRNYVLAQNPKRTHYVDVPLIKNNQMAPLIVISACKSYQKNTEIKVDGKYYGALSFYLYQTLMHCSLTDSRQWTKVLKQQMQQNLRHQSPGIESTLSDIE